MESITNTLMRSIIIKASIILAAADGLIFLLKKGGDAGVKKLKQITAPASWSVPNAAPIRPHTIQGQIDNFIESVTLVSPGNQLAKSQYYLFIDRTSVSTAVRTFY